MIYQNLAMLAILGFVYSVIARRIERTPINGALVFTAFGLLFGPVGLGFIDMDVNAEGMRTIAELTLAVVLFTDAANVNLGVLRQNIGIPGRLLLIGLPLTILFGVGVGTYMFGGLSLLEIAILATMLAPTDAALGKAVVSSESVPPAVRESLNIESGLNDGICVPVLFVFLALATVGAEQGLAIKLLAEEIGIGLFTGIGLTVVSNLLLQLSVRRGWITGSWLQLPVVSLAIGCFAVAQVLGGSGFIAAFSGGLLFGKLAENHKHELLESAEATGDSLSVVTWVIFGAAIVGQSLGSFGWNVFIYAVLSLTVIRIVPVFLALTGSGLRADEKLFMGWFGPRGLASIVFGVIVLNEQLPGGSTITMTVICTVLLSVIFHGVSANPLVKSLAARTLRASG